VADVLGRSIEYAPGADLGSAFGVAWVAGVAQGAWGWTRPPEPADAGAVHHAVPERTARYDALYRRYLELGGVRPGGLR